jgi:enoyl-CoA hydratase/carnithine racemase
VTGAIRRDVADGCAWLTIDNLDQRNALTPAMLVDLRAHLEALASDPDVRVAVITGADGTFSSGFAIDRIPAPDDLPVDDDIELLCQAIEAFPVPVIAAIQGLCVGAALDLVCACDLRLATADAVLGITPAKLGLVYSWRGAARVQRVAGREAARHLFFTGELVRADSDTGRHLVSLAAKDAPTLYFELSRMTEAMAANAPLSITGTKRMFLEIDRAVVLGDQVGADLHRLRQLALGSADHAEARAAFAQRRAPRFVGR